MICSSTMLIAASSYLFAQDVEAYLTGQSSSSDYIQLVAPDLNFAAIPAQQVGQQPHCKPRMWRSRSHSVVRCHVLQV
jgi:hypothetical protein